MADESYKYARECSMLFVETLPPAELAYRVEVEDPELPAWPQVAKELPPDGTASLRWGLRTILVQLAALERYAAATTRAAGTLGWLDKAIGILRDLIQTTGARVAIGDAADGLRQGLRVVTSAGKIAFLFQRDPDFDAYLEIAGPPFSRPAEPNAPDIDWLSDRVFGHLRLAGMNPGLVEPARDLARVLECAEREVVEAALGSDLQQAIAAGRIFVVPPAAFGLLADAVGSHDAEHPFRRRFVCAPTAVFVLDEHTPDLLPLAIRCGPPDRYVAIPAGDGERWRRAKLHYQVAEATYQTYVSHQPQTHLVMEAIAIATRRVFGIASEHPLAVFLEPHIEGTMAVNSISRVTLLGQDSPFSEFIACAPATTRNLMNSAYELQQPRVHLLTGTDLGAGVDDPFRTAHRELTTALSAWADGFVRSHWPSSNPADDREVRAWSDELAAGAHLGFESIADHDGLARVLALIASIATVQHAAFHFPQSSLGRCAAITPLYAADVPPGERISHAHEADVPARRSLPDIHAAAWQGFVLNEADVHWRPLSRLPARQRRATTNEKVHEAADTLEAALDRAERDLATRNAALVLRGLPAYDCLSPKRIICSANT